MHQLFKLIKPISVKPMIWRWTMQKWKSLTEIKTGIDCFCCLLGPNGFSDFFSPPLKIMEMDAEILWPSEKQLHLNSTPFNSQFFMILMLNKGWWKEHGLIWLLKLPRLINCLPFIYFRPNPSNQSIKFMYNEHLHKFVNNHSLIVLPAWSFRRNHPNKRQRLKLRDDCVASFKMNYYQIGAKLQCDYVCVFTESMSFSILICRHIYFS